MSKRVLLTGARAPAALDLARSFAAAGFEVHMADCVPGRMARWSRAVTAMHRFSSPRASRAAFASQVEQLREQLDPVLIVPACEEIFHLAMIGAITDVLFSPELSILRRLHSKKDFADDCAALGLPAPETTRLTSSHELDRFREEARELVFKPEYSRFGTHAIIGPDGDALRAIRPTPDRPWVAQRRIRGAEVSFYAVAVKDGLAAFSAYRSSWRLRGGAGYAFEPLETGLADRVRAIADALASKLVRQGQFACDVMIDGTGAPWLLECNPRATSGVHMFGRSADLALALVGQAPRPVVGGLNSANVGPALWWYGLPEALGRGRLREWRRTGGDVVGAPGDRAPVLGALIDTLAYGARALASGRGLAEMMTDDIEWNGEVP